MENFDGRIIQAAAPEIKGAVVFTCTPEWVAAAAGEEGKPKIPTFKMTAYTGIPFLQDWSNAPVIVDLEGLTIPSQNLPVRLQHDPAQGVGHLDSIDNNGKKLTATGIVSRDTEAAREVVISAGKGFPWQASMGARIMKMDYIDDGNKVAVNGRNWTGPLTVARKAVLGEISFVDLGADTKTSVRVAAKHSMEGKTMQTFDQWVEAQGHDPATLSEELKVTLRAAYDAETRAKDISNTPEPEEPAKPATVAAAAPIAPTDEVPDPVAEIRAKSAAEVTRIAETGKVFGDNFPEVRAKAIAENWDLARVKSEFELATLRAGRARAPGIIVGVDEPGMLQHVLEASCALAGGLSKPETHFPEKVLDAAHKTYGRGIALGQLIRAAARQNGYTRDEYRVTRGMLRAAFQPDVRAGFSTVDIGGILSNVANKFLLEGFYSVERIWRNICSVRPVSDFKTITSYRLTGVDQYELVAPSGELKHGTLGEESFTNKADTYGLMLSLSRTDIKNDDMGAITLIPRKLGRGSGLKINDVFWTVFMDNSAFFTAGRGNYIEGAGTVLGIDGLTAAETAFMDLTDADGKPIGTMPAILLVPTPLSAIGTQLWKSVDVRDTTASTKYPTFNPHLGKFRTEVSRYLSNSSYTGHSTTAFYLLADPNDLSVIEVAFLDGQESPTIESADARFDVLGVDFRGYHDFGVALQDPRAGVKSKGSA